MTVQDLIDQLSKLDRNVEVVVAIPYWLPVDTEIPVQRLWVDGASPRKLMIEMETASPPWDKPKSNAEPDPIFEDKEPLK